jgi:hypothetical protein
VRKLGICAICRKEKELFYFNDGGRICRACYKSKVNKKECCICHKVKSVQVRKNGKPVCAACYRKEILLEECSICHNIKPVNFRKNGKAICGICYQRDILVEECSKCHQIRSVATRKNGEVICRKCYQTHFHKGKCSICHRIRPISIRNKNGEPVCNTCYIRSRTRKSKFIQKFLYLPLGEAVLFVAQGISRRELKFLRNLKYAKENNDCKKKLAEVFAVMNEFSSGQRILASFFSTKTGEQFSRIIARLD